MLNESNRDYLGNTLLISKFLASKHVSLVQNSTPRKTVTKSKKSLATKQLDPNSIKFAKGDINRGLHERLDFDDKSAYIGVMLYTEDRIPWKGHITLNLNNKKPHFKPQEPNPVHRKVDSSYLRWNQSDVLKFLDGNTKVDPEKLFIDIVSAYKRYCYFESDETYYLLSLWIIGTYLFPIFPAYPLILLNGPLGAGKSRTHAVSACMAFNARSLTDPNSAIMFRLVDRQRASLFFDDAEWAARKTPSRFLSTLKSSYKSTAKIARLGSNRDGSIDEYEIYSPKMFNNIDGIEKVLGSRTITFTQKVAPKSVEIDKHDPNEDDPHWAEIKNRLYLFTLNYWQDVKKLLPEQTKLPLRNRMYEIYCGILSIAQFLDSVSKQKGLHKLVLDAAMRDVEERKVEFLNTDPKALIIQALLKLTDGWYSVSQIASTIKKATSSTREITPIETGKILKSLGLGKIKSEFRRPREATGRSSEYLIRRAAVIQLAKQHNVIEE